MLCNCKSRSEGKTKLSFRLLCGNKSEAGGSLINIFKQAKKYISQGVKYFKKIIKHISQVIKPSGREDSYMVKTKDPIPHSNPVSKEQAIADLIESIALEGAAIAHILNAEEKKSKK
jgi:predicted ATP-dependent Lon-type protease